MKKSELKSLIFEAICNHYQATYRQALLKEGWNDDEEWDDEPYKPEPHYSEQYLNDIEQAIISSVERPDNKAITVKSNDGTTYVILGRTVREGMYKDYIKVHVQWEGKSGSGAETGIIHPDRYKVDSGAINYIMHKVMRKIGLLREDKAKDRDMVYGINEDEGAVLPDSMDIMLNRFPTLRHALQRLMTDQFTEFVSGVDWVSPKPSQFRINLKNGQNFILKWMGKDFEATISGKKYYLGQLTDFQQALNKLSILYQEGPMGEEEPGAEGGASGADSGSGFGGGGGGGSFPGAEGGPEGGNEGGPEEAGNEAAPEGGEEDKDMKDQEIDFEADETV